MNQAAPHVGSEHLRAAVEAAAAIASLPAVATQDWCARAAAGIRPARPNAIVAVTLAILGPRGSIIQLEATGAVGTDPLGRPLEGDAVHPEHAPGLDWWLESDIAPAPTTSGGAILHELNCYSRWLETPAGRRWLRLGVNDLIVGVCPIPGAAPGRCLAVELGSPGGAPLAPAELEVVKASLGLLARRALLAFGLERSTALSRLTYREQQVLDHLSLGKSVKEIAQDLARSPHTVHDHVKSLHRKLNASSRGELIARALGHLAATSRSNPTPAVSDPSSAVVVARPTLLSA